MSQDVLALGLDISQFSPEKLTLLDEFLVRFDKLEKYEGKKFSPVSGDGLASFNASIKETSILLDELNAKMASVNFNKNKGQSTAVSQVKTDAVAATEAVSNTGKEVDKTSLKVKLLGKELTVAFSALRTIAYILPGIGIAGIFNLAFEGISKAAQALGVFSTALTDQEKVEDQLNKSLLNQLELYTKIYEQQKKLSDLTNSQGFKAKEKLTEIAASGGANKETILTQQLANTDLRLKTAINQLGGETGLKQYVDDLNSAKVKIDDLADAIVHYQHVLDSPDERTFKQRSVSLYSSKGKTVNGISEKSSKDEVAAAVDDMKSSLAEMEKQYDLQFNIVKEYYDSKEAYEKKSAEKTKFESDQERERFIKTESDKLRIVISNNEAILKNERSTQDQKLDAIKNSGNAQAGLIALEYKNIHDNSLTNPKEDESAKSKANEQLIANTTKVNSEVFKVNEEYFQRQVKSFTEMDNNELISESVKNERIYQNENKSLEERIDAYKKYIQQKQAIAINEFNEKGQVPGLTPDEQNSLVSNKERDISETTADSERKIYEIVHSWGQKKLKDIVEINKAQNSDYEESYHEQLSNLNLSFANKLISFNKYTREKKSIDEQYKIDSSTNDVKNDEQELQRLRTNLEDRLKEKRKASSDLKGATPDTLPGLTGSYNATSDNVVESQKAITEAEKKLRDDKLKGDKAMYDELIQYQKEFESNKKEIIQAAFNFVKTITDAEFQIELEKVQRVKEITDEQYSQEEYAVEKSSLDAVDKTALDIQLAEQKREYDKNVALEERKLKTDKAILDRDLNVAHILWNTEESISSALTAPPGIGEALAAERAILGAIEVATVLATPIPSYSEGTENHPGGIARYGENGVELVKEPYKSPYFVIDETIGYLPKGTQVVPIKDNPVFSSESAPDGWEQTVWLARQMKKNTPKINTKNIINIDLGFEMYKHKKLYGA